MSRLTDLIAKAKAKDADLGRELEREFRALSSRRAFGLNFERHRPENVELPGRPIRKGDKVRILPERGSTKKGDQRLWKVMSLAGRGAERVASLSLLYTDEPERAEVPVADLVVVAEFRDYIYPGLVSTGKVERGGDKPFHTVINGENFHALEALTFTHRGKVDAIYIDPPYNSGATDWKYNNYYVDKDDAYRHSKWLAMMERRLLIARQLLNPNNSVLIVTIDEKEYLRLGILLEQVFPEARSQMISSMINPKGSARGKEFYRVDEYVFMLRFGSAVVQDFLVPGLCITKGPESADSRDDADSAELPKVRWASMLRSGKGAQREDSHLKFYPIYVDEAEGRIIGCGEYLPLGKNPEDISPDSAIRVCWPYRSDGRQGRWQLKVESFRDLLKDRHIKIGRIARDKVTFYYLMEGQREKLLSGDLIVTGQDEYGGIEVGYSNSDAINGRPKTQWTATSHSATDHGTSILAKLLPGRAFDYPKSPYAVEDALRFFIADKPHAIVLDFFAGSGTTAHAVMRLNKQDGGRRQCISVTNNEVGADEQAKLRKDGLRPGDPDWEQWGICDYITKPRIKAAITGQTPENQPIKGDYKFTDEFPMADGFEENAEFFTLTYETPVAVSHNRAFERIAPLLWMRAGSEGTRIETLPDGGLGVTEIYGLLIDLDMAAPFAEIIRGMESVRIAYIVTDDERRFQSVVQQLPDRVEPVRLYESYLTNFRFSMGR
jgi:adenine-specific DNA-methyltransferase